MNTRTTTLNNLNTLFQNAFANNTNLANKEIPTMQPLKAFALTCATLFVALTGAVRPAHADVVITSIRDPYHAQGVAANQTTLQFLVANTANTAVSNQKVSVNLVLNLGFSTCWRPPSPTLLASAGCNRSG